MVLFDLKKWIEVWYWFVDDFFVVKIKSGSNYERIKKKRILP